MSQLQSDIPCPLCNQSAPAESVGNGFDGSLINCPNCGAFQLSKTVKGEVAELSVLDRARLSYWVYSNQHAKHEGGIEIHSDNLQSILDSASNPTPAEKANRILLWLGDQIQIPGQNVPVNTYAFHARIGAVSRDEVMFYFESLGRQGLIEPGKFRGSLPELRKVPVRLTFEGWSRFDELKRTRDESRRAFMAMKFGDLILDSMFSQCFRPAVAQTGFSLEKVSARAGSIDRKIELEIRTSRFIIADLTHDNDGAYWEAGLAEGLGKHVIYTCESRKFESKGTHFDTDHRHTVRWNREDPCAAAEDLKTVIRLTFPDAVMIDSQESA